MKVRKDTYCPVQKGIAPSIAFIRGFTKIHPWFIQIGVQLGVKSTKNHIVFTGVDG